MSDLLAPFAGLTLASPSFLLLALAVPAALWLRRRAGEPAVRFTGGRFLRPEGHLPGGGDAGFPVSLRARLVPLPGVLTVLGLLLAVVALARPVRRETVPRVAEGIDILLLIDTSSSMAEDDLQPGRTRLAVAREAAARFVSGRPQDRIGLVTFARYPDLRCPPTPDHAALLRLLDSVALVPAEGPEDATGIGTAVARAAEVLRRSPSPGKVVILFTDGEENVATAGEPREIAPLHAGQLCRQERIRVYTIAAGTGTRKASGEFAALDTAQVRRLSEETGGRFYTAEDAGAVAGVYARIDGIEKAKHAEPLVREVDAFAPFLAAALALMLSARVLSATVLGVRP